MLTVKAHEGIVKGMCFTNMTGEDQRLLSCASDRTVKLWDPYATENGNVPVATYLGSGAFNGVTHHRSDHTFATASSTIEIWDATRSKPVTTLNWGVDTINTVKFNQSETSILASAGTDRTLIFYDLRTSSPVAKLVTSLRTNAICWNPMEPFNLAAGNEDHNTYVFDMRKLNRALNVLKDHVAAVMDVDYSPTGEELVTGSYDRTIRIYKAREGHSRYSSLFTLIPILTSQSRSNHSAETSTTPSACSVSSPSPLQQTPATFSRAQTTATFVSGVPRPLPARMSVHQRNV